MFLPVGKLYRTSLAQAQGHNLPPKGTWLGRATGSVSTQGGGGASRGHGTVLGSGKTGGKKARSLRISKILKKLELQHVIFTSSF